MPIGRRGALGLIGAGIVSSAIAMTVKDHGVAKAVSAKPLRWHAARRGMSVGMALSGPELLDPAARRLIANEVDLIQPGTALKWRVVEEVRGKTDYSLAEPIIAQGEAMGLKIRGHTAFWYRSLPGWAPPLLTGAAAQALVVKHIGEVIGHFRGRIAEWDVMNEVVMASDGMPGGFRKAPFGHAIDAGFYAECFHAAHDADPATKLFYNEAGIEGDSPFESAQRASVLALLTELKRRGAPVQALGIEAHLATYRRFSPDLFRKFLADVAALGIGIRLTEFDVTDHRVVGPIAVRDAAVASYAARFLDTAFDERAVEGLTIWQLRNRDSWLQSEDWTKRLDGLPLRPLPFDDDLTRTPLWTAIARAFDDAPAR